MTQTINFDGQIAKYNSERNVLVTTIKEPFMSAGKKLGWNNHQPQGFGFNLKLIEFVLKRKCVLVIYVDSWHCTLFVKHDVLRQFLENNSCDYKIRNTVLKVIAKDICIDYHPKVAA